MRLSLTPAGRGGWSLALAAGLLLVAGCQSGEPPSGRVTGTVTYNGAPVDTGNVNFQTAAGKSEAVAKIEGGRYALDGPLPVGPYDVYLTESFPDPTPGVDTKAVPLKVPKKYLSAATSGLKVEVKAGANDLPIELKD
jgi:hypothetical protein